MNGSNGDIVRPAKRLFLSFSSRASEATRTRKEICYSTKTTTTTATTTRPTKTTITVSRRFCLMIYLAPDIPGFSCMLEW